LIKEKIIMANIISQTVGSTTVGANYLKHAISTSDAGRTLIVKIALSNMTDANVSAMINAIGQAGGSGNGTDQDGPDAFTIAGVGTANGAAFVSGTTDVLFLKVQGTGTFDTTVAAASTGATVTVEAVFQAAL
jgi:hypothetical protein